MSPYQGAAQPLFARLDGAETVELDARVPPAVGPSGKGTFLAATADGSKVFFSAPGKLTSTAAAAGELYRYDMVERQLTDITPGSVAPEIEGFSGASADGSYVYFVAQAALTGGERSAAGEQAEAGANNLYLWHEGEGLRFVARLADRDQDDWSVAPERLTARVAPTGALAFLTLETEALSGYDNLVFPGAGCELLSDGELVGDPHCIEAYLYEPATGQLDCASCNPSGERPAGPTQWPGWSNPLEGPRYLSADGQRLFFESDDALSAADQNGHGDVYEFERSGAGSCTPTNPSYDPLSGGCHFLLSSGGSEERSYLLDASSSGRDVFFSTRQSLVTSDTNENYDVYDAREGGGFASQNEPVAPPVCEGLEACRSPLSELPAQLTPGSAALVGPGNLALALEQPAPKQSGVKPSAKCKKGFARTKGKCVKKRKAKRKAKAKRKRKRGKLRLTHRKGGSR